MGHVRNVPNALRGAGKLRNVPNVFAIRESNGNIGCENTSRIRNATRAQRLPAFCSRHHRQNRRRRDLFISAAAWMESIRTFVTRDTVFPVNRCTSPQSDCTHANRKKESFAVSRSSRQRSARPIVVRHRKLETPTVITRSEDIRKYSIGRCGRLQNTNLMKI